MTGSLAMEIVPLHGHMGDLRTTVCGRVDKAPAADGTFGPTPREGSG